jgi:hypothetical protein
MPSRMKICEDYRTAMRGAAAAGVEPSLELRSHLNACASCRATFTEETQLLAAIDLGLRIAANAEVPVSLLPRVRVRLNQERVPRRAWIPAGAAMAAAVAIVAVLVFVRGFRRDSVSISTTVNSFAHNASRAQIQPPPPVVASIETTSPPARIKALHPGETASADAAARVESIRVLIPAGQRKAIEALLAGVQQGKVDGEVLLAEKPENALEELQVAPLDVSPVEVKPLADVGAESPSEHEKTRR